MKKKVLIGTVILGMLVLGGLCAMKVLGYQFVNPYKQTVVKQPINTRADALTKENKEQQEHNAKLEAAKKIYVSDTSYEDNSVNTKITFTINNDSNLKATYMEFQIYVYDENGNMIHSDWTNESNMPANSKRIKSTYVNMPEGAARYEVVISDLRF